MTTFEDVKQQVKEELGIPFDIKYDQTIHNKFVTRRIGNIISVVKMATWRVYWCIKKGFPLRLAICDIPFDDIPSSTYFAHPYGITIAKGTRLGEHCVFASNVTIGTRRPFFGEPQEIPAIIGNGVFFGAGCVVLGAVVLGDGYIVGANKVIKG